MSACGPMTPIVRQARVRRSYNAVGYVASKDFETLLLICADVIGSTATGCS